MKAVGKGVHLTFKIVVSNNKMPYCATWKYQLHFLPFIDVRYFFWFVIIWSQYARFPLSLTPGCFCCRSQDLEDPELRGGSARCRRVHAEHLPERAATQPRAARVHPLQPPAHPHQGLHVGPLRRVAVDLQANSKLTWLCFSSPCQPAEVPLGRWNQESLPQRSLERASWWLRGPWWVNLPTAPRWDQSPLSAFVTGPQLHSPFTCVLCCPGAPEPTSPLSVHCTD